MLTVYNQVKSVIDAWDPVELLSTHAPSDEYDDESIAVAQFVASTVNLTSDRLAEYLHHLFSNRFGSDVFVKTIDECLKVSLKIMVKLSERYA